jgi:hypothetical protein
MNKQILFFIEFNTELEDLQAEYLELEYKDELAETMDGGI